MITNKSIDIENCESRIANIESKIQAAQVDVETAKSNLDAAVNEKTAAEAALAEQEKLEDYVLYMIGNVKASATLRGARTHTDNSMVWWYFNSEEDFAQEVAKKLGATPGKNSGQWIGSHRGCKLMIWFEKGETLVALRDAEEILSTLVTNESIKESLDGSYELDQTYNLYDWVRLRDGRNVVIIGFENYEYVGLSEVSVALNEYEPIRFFETDVDYRIESSAVTKWTNRAKDMVDNCTEDDCTSVDNVMGALNRADELDEGTFSRVINKIRRATLDEHDPNNRKLYNFVDKFKKEFGIKAETKNAGYGYLRDGDNEVRNYRMYLNCDSEVTKQFFIDGKAYKGLKPEYASRFTMNGASNYKPNDAMSDGEIQVEISLDTIYFDLHVVMNAAKAEKNRETYNKRFAKAYELDDDM